ncbi:MAG: hypothetical protein AAFN78_12930 [Pseudomonadota bacterium]
MPDERENFDAHAARALLGLAATEAPPDGVCPTLEELSAWQARALSEEDAARLDAHVPHCLRCLELWTGMLEATGVLEPALEPAPTPGPWRFLHRWRGAAVAASAVAVFAVAGVLLQQTADRPALAAYTLQIDDRMSQRGNEAGDATVVTYGAGDAFTLTARPDTAVDEAVRVQLFVDAGSGPVPLALPPARIAPTGAVQVTGTVGLDVPLPEGQSVLYVVVGRTDGIPGVEDIVSALGDQPRASDSDWTAWRFRLTVEQDTQP